MHSNASHVNRKRYFSALNCQKTKKIHFLGYKNTKIDSKILIFQTSALARPTATSSYPHLFNFPDSGIDSFCTWLSHSKYLLQKACCLNARMVVVSFPSKFQNCLIPRANDREQKINSLWIWAALQTAALADYPNQTISRSKISWDWCRGFAHSQKHLNLCRDSRSEENARLLDHSRSPAPHIPLKFGLWLTWNENIPTEVRGCHDSTLWRATRRSK